MYVQALLYVEVDNLFEMTFALTGKLQLMNHVKKCLNAKSQQFKIY